MHNTFFDMAYKSKEDSSETYYSKYMKTCTSFLKDKEHMAPEARTNCINY
jgi:hypothetical protein